MFLHRIPTAFEVWYLQGEQRVSTTRSQTGEKSVDSAFWLSLQTQPVRGANVREKEEGRQASTNQKSTLPRHVSKMGTGWVDRTDRMCPGHCPYDEPNQPPAGQSVMQDGLASAARDCKIRMGELTHPRNRRLSVVQFMRTSRLRGALHGRTGTMVSMRRQGRQCKKVVRAGNIVVLDEKNPHIRNTRDGTVIKLDVNNGVYTLHMWICIDETGPVFSWQGQ